MDDQKALSATSRSFRGRFIAQVQIVTSTDVGEFALGINCRWPLLSMVILLNRDAIWPEVQPPDRVLAHVAVADREFDPASIFMLRPLYTSAPDLAWVPLAAQLTRQVTIKWPGLVLFLIFNVELPALATAIIAQLRIGRWPSLGDVHLSNCELSAQALSLLGQSKWPALMRLDVSRTGLDAEGMAMLAKGNWPLLSDINLRYNSTLDAAAIAQLSTTNWPLTSLSLSHTPVSAAMAAELAQLHLPNLKILWLNSTGLTAAAMSELASVDWPTMQCLYLSDNDLDAAGMQHLCKMHLPALHRLYLSHANILAEGACWLVQGSWPLLTDLDLSHNQLDANAIDSIVNGVWPELRSLLLAGNAFGHDGLQLLIKANWPLLECLSIGLNMLKRCDSCLLLGLDPYQVQKRKFRMWSYMMHRNVSLTETSLWPNLEAVTICRRF